MINHSLSIRHQDGVTMDIPAVTGARACERRSVQRALNGFFLLTYSPGLNPIEHNPVMLRRSGRVRGAFN